MLRRGRGYWCVRVKLFAAKRATSPCINNNLGSVPFFHYAELRKNGILGQHPGAYFSGWISVTTNALPDFSALNFTLSPACTLSSKSGSFT